jgi:membrane protein DedA with SNARE-associated domain
MEDWIARWGVWAVLLGAATEGDATLLIGGVVAHHGLLRLPAVWGAGFLGALASDCAIFAFARRHRERVRASALFRRAAPALERWAARLGPRQLLAARFVYGSRVASMVFWGIHGLGWREFLPRAAAGAASWTLALGGLGWVAGRGTSALLGAARDVEIGLAVVAAAAAAAALHLYRRRGVTP